MVLCRRRFGPTREGSLTEPRLSPSQLPGIVFQIRECTALLPVHQRIFWRSRVNWLAWRIKRDGINLSVDGPMICNIARTVSRLLDIVGIWSNRPGVDAAAAKLREITRLMGCED